MGYDRYGNLLTINSTQCTNPVLSLTVNPANNHVTSTGYVYDAAGSVTNDGTQSYTWNAEGKMVTAGGVTYTYDGAGQRVKKSNGTLYWYSISGALLTETDLSGNLTNNYEYFGGGRIARSNSSGTWFYYGDHLGSSRSITDSTGHLCYDADFYLFGADKVLTNTCAQNYKWTGLEHDMESGLDHTLNRQYSSNTGRWLSPDALGGTALGPQSLNRYVYAMNNPLNATDRLGLQGEWSGNCTSNGYTGTGCSWGGGSLSGTEGWHDPSDTSVLSPYAGMLMAGMVFNVTATDYNYSSYQALTSDSVNPSAGPMFQSMTVTAHVYTYVPMFPSAGAGSGCAARATQQDLMANLSAQINHARQVASAALLDDPECLAFLGAWGVSPLSALLNTPVGLDFFNPKVPARTDLKTDPGSMVPTNPKITFNRLGAFFGGNVGLQVFVYLHEIGHVTGALAQDDAENATSQAKNNAAIREHCSKALSAARYKGK